MTGVGKVVGILFFPFAGVLLAGLIWTWVRFLRMRQRTVFSILSLVALTLTTTTVPLPFLSLFHYQWFDVAQGLGPQVSLVAIPFALGGALRPSPIRWHCLACALGVFVLWMIILTGG